MSKNWMMSTALLAVWVTAAAAAQSMKDMATPSNGHMTSTTYTGCVKPAADAGGFLLTDVVAMKAEHGAMTMKHDDMTMKHDDMAMKSDAGKPIGHEQMPMADGRMEAAPKALALAGASNLEKHAGQKVSVTGSLSDGSMDAMHPPTFTVKTLKVIAKSCS